MVFFVSQLGLKVQNNDHHMINQPMSPPHLFKEDNTRGFHHEKSSISSLIEDEKELTE